MSNALSFAEFDGQHAELLPARTVLSSFSSGFHGGEVEFEGGDGGWGGDGWGGDGGWGGDAVVANNFNHSAWGDQHNVAVAGDGGWGGNGVGGDADGGDGFNHHSSHWGGWGGGWGGDGGWGGGWGH